MLGYNKVIGVEDLSTPELRDVIRDVFAHELELFPPEYPDSALDSRQWEIAMAVRALRDHGCLTPAARILGVGAGSTITPFYLARAAGQVVAIDLYADAGSRADEAPLPFLIAPAAFSPISYPEERLIAVHMDARQLRFPADSFDGVFSIGFVEHSGSLNAVANTAYEIGRVLRPGGVAAISTTYKVAGPPDGDAAEYLLFTQADLMKYVVDASGLELIGPFDAEVSEETLSHRRDLQPLVNASAAKIASYPNMVLYREGYLFCSVHLALKKTDSYPSRDNSWAAPGAEVLSSLRKTGAKAMARLGGSLLRRLGRPEEDPELLETRRRLEEQTSETNRLHHFVARQEEHIRIQQGLYEDAQRRLAEMETQLADLTQRHADALRDVDQHRVALADAQTINAHLMNSVSWRVTAPLRGILAPFLRKR